MRTTLLNDRAVKLSKAKVYVFSVSVLFLGTIREYPRSMDAWKEKIEWDTGSLEYRELDCTDGEPVVFEWQNFPGLTTLQLLRELQTAVEENRIQP